MRNLLPVLETHRLAENRYDFFAMDLRGHEKCDGDPALIVSIEQTIRDFNQFFEMSLKKFYGEKIEDLPPTYLMGNSFGCIICLKILLCLIAFVAPAHDEYPTCSSAF